MNLAGDTSVPQYDSPPDPELSQKPHRAERPYLFRYEGSGLFPEGMSKRWSLDAVIEAMTGLDDGVHRDPARSNEVRASMLVAERRGVLASPTPDSRPHTAPHRTAMHCIVLPAVASAYLAGPNTQ